MNLTKAEAEPYIRLAMEQAGLAIERGDEPFGAVLLTKEGVIHAAGNTANSAIDTTAHAEMNLIRKLYHAQGRAPFQEGALFVNAASCCMCAAALIRVGVRKFYCGAPFEPHTNPAASYEQLESFCREPIYYIGGILVEECVAQIAHGRRLERKPQW